MRRKDIKRSCIRNASSSPRNRTHWAGTSPAARVMGTLVQRLNCCGRVANFHAEQNERGKEISSNHFSHVSESTSISLLQLSLLSFQCASFSQFSCFHRTKYLYSLLRFEDLAEQLLQDDSARNCGKVVFGAVCNFPCPKAVFLSSPDFGTFDGETRPRIAESKAAPWKSFDNLALDSEPNRALCKSS